MLIGDYILVFFTPWSGIFRFAALLVFGLFFFFSRVDLLTPGARAPELKGRARGKPSLLAAARPMRAILPAPSNMGRGNSMGLPRARQAFPLSGKGLGQTWEWGAVQWEGDRSGS